MKVLSLRAEASSAAAARHALEADLHAQQLHPQVIDDAVLIVSELVSNAVQHAPVGPADMIEIDWLLAGAGVHVQVTCPGTSDKIAARTPAPTETSGRGLSIVATIAADWGVEQSGRGVTVWARLNAEEKSVR